MTIKLKQDDKSAFSHTFSAYYRDLVLFIFNFTHNSDSAEEIVQDTIVRSSEDHESLDINISLKSYLLKSVRNKWIDWHRHHKVIQKYNSEVLESSIGYNYDTDNYILYWTSQNQTGKKCSFTKWKY